ncbi:MAG: hypothetical protein U0822_16400 [Anaerolineae bacterium]
MTPIEWSSHRKIPPWKPLLIVAAVLMLIVAACGTAANQQGSASAPSKVEVVPVPVDSGKSVVVAPAGGAAQVQVPPGSQVQVVPVPQPTTVVQVVPAQPAQVQVVPAAPPDQPPTAPGRDAVPVAANAPDGTASGDTQAGAAFARWVMDQDPQQKLITAAVVRNDANLSVKVNPSATKADVQNLMVALAQGMAKTFPGKPVTVDGFYQSGDKLATATYDPLTSQVSVQWLQ